MHDRVLSFTRVPEAKKLWAAHLIEYEGRVTLGAVTYDYCVCVNKEKRFHELHVDIEGKGPRVGWRQGSEFDCPKCRKEFSPGLFKALTPMIEKDTGFKVKRSIYMSDYGWFSLWSMKPGVVIPHDAEPVRTKGTRVAPEVVKVDMWYEGVCPVHGKVLVHDTDVAD